MEHPEKVVLDGDDMRRTLVRIAHEIVEKNAEPEALAIVGIHRRGALLAARVKDLVDDLLDAEVPLGDLDISFYRDDLASRPEQPVVHASHIDFPLEDRTVVVVDDVLYTGRTARAAIEALFGYGRPARVQLAVLADRGHRELPIRPDYVGKNLPTARSERVNVRVEELESIAEVSGREIKKLPTLRGRRVINLFYEASTRTRSSFEIAARTLSADVTNVVSSGSSVEKGESLKDTVLTLSAYDPAAIVMRHPHAGAAALVARWTPAAVVNAGDGKHEHPTQALLDVFTLTRRLGPFDGTRILIVGDVQHSRVARSDIQAFTKLGAPGTGGGPPTPIP